VAKRIEDGCSIPECEPPMNLDPGRCDHAKCVEGRAAPKTGGLKSCWDFALTYVESGGRASGRTVEHQIGPTARFAVGVAAAGSVALDIDWAGCTDCELIISEHNSEMANLVVGDRKRTGDVQSIVFPVTSGPYYILGSRPGPAHDYSFSLRVLDESGAPQSASLHGLAWQRVCEG
jgi:hypothetical protein